MSGALTPVARAARALARAAEKAVPDLDARVSEYEQVIREQKNALV